jgi:hypothetical protein
VEPSINLSKESGTPVSKTFWMRFQQVLNFSLKNYSWVNQLNKLLHLFPTERKCVFLWFESRFTGYRVKQKFLQYFLKLFQNVF